MSFGRISFPEGALGEEPCRMPILYFKDNVLALPKHRNVLIAPHPWYPKLPTLLNALREQIAEGRGILTDLGVQEVHATYLMDPEMTGVVVLGTSEEKAAEVKNAVGSDMLTFEFIFLARQVKDVKDEIICELPLAVHSQEPKVLVSHKTGKKTKTIFKKIGGNEKYCLWQAQTNYLRLHQIPVHAMECGLRIVGERLYSEEPEIYLSSMKKRYKRKGEEERPLHEEPMIHLRKVEGSGIGVIEAEIPPKFKVTLKKLDITNLI